ncbi:MAG: TonB-dependent receptor, partial [Alphaproteobacteria bacterium]|nr:TonB-dependent receptor [Alphaproteobacteria bacterium]
MLLAGSGLAALLGPTLVQAQTAAPAPQPEVTDSTDIIVTATRRDQLLSKVPISVSAFTQKRADELGIKSFTDVAKFTPGVAISQSNSGNDNIAIRGVSSNAGASTTGIYIDDTPIQIRQLGLNSNGAEPIVFDLDRVEVLRGPQGTLFGSGSEGGTVRYITPEANLNKTQVYARSELDATQGGAPSYEGGVAVGMPIIPGQLAARVSAYYHKDGGYINRQDPYTNQVTPDANSIDSIAFRGALTWEPSSHFKATPSIMYQNRLNHGTDVGGYYVGLSNPSNGSFTEATPTPMQDRDHYMLAALKMEWSNSTVKLISNTSYFDRTENVNGYDGTTYNLSYYQHSYNPALDPTGAGNANGASASTFPYLNDPFGNLCNGLGAANSPGAPCTLQSGISPLLTAQGINPAFTAAYSNFLKTYNPANGTNFDYYRSPNLIVNQQQNFTQELRLQSNVDESKWNWTVGLFYSYIKQNSDEQIFDPQLDAISQFLYGESALAVWQVPLLADGASYENHGTSTEWQAAAFADVTYDITPKLKANVGLRWAKAHFAFNNVTQGPEAFGAKVSSGSQASAPLTPKFNLSYQIDPGNMVYATVSKGFRVGGANAPLLPVCGVTAPTQFTPDTIWNYEVGAKMKAAGGKLRFATSAYIINWSNIQQSVYVGSCGQQFVGNLGSLTSKGFDLQVEAHPARNLSLDLAVGYTHARYTKDSIIPADATQLNSNALLVGLAGDSVPGAPWTVSGGLQYDFHLGGHKAFIRADDEYASHNFANLTNTDPGTRTITNIVNGVATPATV